MPRSFCWLGFCSVLATLLGCSSEAQELESRSSRQAMRSAELVDVSGGVVEIQSSDGNCTATLINQNTLITAAHCRTQHSSHWPTMKVLYQENSTTWRCLTNTNANGTAITGSRASVISACAGRQVGFGSMFDYGDTSHYFSINGGSFSAREHDFAVVKVWDAGFVWVGTNSANYAAIYADTISNGWEWGYGAGLITPGGSQDGRIRRDSFNVNFNDTFVLSAPGANAQVCSGDSGGPLGVFLASPAQFAVVGVLAGGGYTYDGSPSSFCAQANTQQFWANAVTRIWYVETATGQACRRVNHAGVLAAECW